MTQEIVCQGVLTSWDWTHDTGFDPAYDHEGHAAAVLDDGTDTDTGTYTYTAATGPRVTGWRAACAWGWRSERFHPRVEWPDASPLGLAPEAVDGFESGGGCFGEWGEHLHDAVPELTVHDLAAALAQTSELLEQAVTTARGRDVPV